MYIYIYVQDACLCFFAEDGFEMLRRDGCSKMFQHAFVMVSLKISQYGWRMDDKEMVTAFFGCEHLTINLQIITVLRSTNTESVLVSINTGYRFFQDPKNERPEAFVESFTWPFCHGTNLGWLLSGGQEVSSIRSELEHKSARCHGAGESRRVARFLKKSLYDILE